MSAYETCARCGRTYLDSQDYDEHDCIITALPIGGECGEEVVRRGLLEPCELPAVAVRINPDDPLRVYPVCNRHARGHTVPLMTVLSDMRQEVRELIAQKIEVERCRHDQARIGPSAVGDAYAHAARIALGDRA